MKKITDLSRDNIWHEYSHNIPYFCNVQPIRQAMLNGDVNVLPPVRTVALIQFKVHFTNRPVWKTLVSWPIGLLYCQNIINKKNWNCDYDFFRCISEVNIWMILSQFQRRRRKKNQNDHRNALAYENIFLIDSSARCGSMLLCYLHLSALFNKQQQIPSHPYSVFCSICKNKGKTILN